MLFDDCARFFPHRERRITEKRKIRKTVQRTVPYPERRRSDPVAAAKKVQSGQNAGARKTPM